MGMSSLHILVSLGTPEAVDWLLDRGAELHFKDYQFDSTALAWAARTGREEMVQQLLTRGAQPARPDDEPWATPAAWARRRGHTRLLRLL
jgi:ankyrin repeat protein